MTASPPGRDLRAEVRDALKRWDPIEREAAARRMIERFYQKFVAGGAAARTFGLYDPLPLEPDLRDLALRLRAEGHRVVLPQVTPEQRLVYGELGPAQIDVLVVPGRVFGERGERMGRGRGDFDRYLASTARGKPLRVALAFELQVRPAVPQQSWDQPMDWIVTEKREIKAP